MRIFSILTCLLLFAGQGLTAESGTAQGTRADVVRLLQEISARAPTRKNLMALGFRGENLELAVRQSQVFIQDPKIAGYIADRIIEANNGNVPVQQFSNGLVFPLIDRGLSHLPTREMRHFYLVEHRVINALSTRDCGLAVKDRLRSERQYELTSRIEARMNTAALRDFYRIQLKAARLGVSRPAAVLSKAAEARIINKVNMALAARVAASEDTRGMIAAYQNLNRVNNRRACAAGRLFMEAILSMEGRDLRDALIFLSGQ